MINVEATFSHLDQKTREALERFNQSVAAGLIRYDADGWHFPGEARQDEALRQFVNSKVTD